MTDTKVELETVWPPPKRYAHHGKRRRSYTDELFRCPFTDKISRSDLVCNALLWRNRPHDLREHLLTHMPEAILLTDDEVADKYLEAKKIYLEGIPEDIDDEEDIEYELDDP